MSSIPRKGKGERVNWCLPGPAIRSSSTEESVGPTGSFYRSDNSRLSLLCDAYEVSYPALRARLDRLIAKVKAADDPKAADSFQRKLHVLVADGKMSAALARELWKAHRAVAEEGMK